MPDHNVDVDKCHKFPLISDIDIEVEYLSSEHTSLTLFNTKRGTNLGTLVVPFDQIFHPLHK